ncbi:outer membrane beta-barrel protein [Parabacteroides sp. GYB001]|uniref:porin family protein n=1 Tax=Parabacteroides leei TaxID=2939491 RepID=UPI0020181D4C|nr:porin family protein [Parabacteroides leei]MCL3854455.1 outer membrane beta-barrel protein [Parabacteroides leei]
MKKERDTFDDMFRSKLQDFEVDTMPEDWGAIADRLPVKAPVSFRRTLRYWAAAAVISLLMITGGVYMFKSEREVAPIAEKIEKETKKVETELAKDVEAPVAQIEEKITVSPVAAVQQPAVVRSTYKAAVKVAHTEPAVISSDDDLEEQAEVITDPDEDSVVVDREEVVQDHPEVGSIDTRSLIADAAPVGKVEKEAAPRKWGFGMGGGSVTTGTNNSLNTYALKNTMMTDQELLFLNSPNFENSSLPKTNIHHKTPVSVGFSVSRYLNNRFALSTGLNYTFLSSTWDVDAPVYYNKTAQKLHFIGIPVSLSYKIAEWNRFQVYAAAGVMTEVNVSGKLITEKYSGKELYEKESEHIRMKEWLWSVNARAGVSYPLLRFVSLYAEAGVDYYFDNGSTIETVRSEKPFNVSLQAGFRLGF